jgi:hypothetical protein
MGTRMTRIEREKTDLETTYLILKIIFCDVGLRDKRFVKKHLPIPAIDP